MTLNLFMKLPNSHPGTSDNGYFVRSLHSFAWALSGSGGVALAIHVYIALGLLLGTTALFIRSLYAHSKIWSWAAGVAALLTLGALFNGLSFVNYNEDFSSMIMAACWLLAVTSLVIGLVKSVKNGNSTRCVYGQSKT
jgi:hypothetical protein